MPCAAAMAFRMSRRLALLKWRLSGSRDAGLRIGSADAARARSRIAWIAGLGRDASMRSRIVRSSAATFADAGRLLGSYSLAAVYSPSAASS